MNHDKPSRSPHRKRLKRYDEPNEARFLTFSCFRRQPFLVRSRSCKWFIDGLNSARIRHDIAVWAFVIKPEHIHLLVYPRATEFKISKFLYTLKKSVSNRAIEYVKTNAPEFLEKMKDLRPSGSEVYRFWQRGGGYDESLFRPRKIWEKIDYIHMNPVRRGLCNAPKEWSWSSARAYAF